MYWRVTENALDGEREARLGLEKAHQDLAQAQELSDIGSWDWDVTSNTVTWSNHLYAIAGVDRATFTPTIEAFLALVHHDDRTRVDESIQTAYSEGTGLASRRLFLNRLEHALVEQKRSARPSAVLFIDLNDFKTVNDSFGHRAGDQLLCEVARRLQAAVRAGDTVARFGGDEFALLCQDGNLETANRTAQRIAAALRRPIDLDGATVSVQGSIGIAVTEGTMSADDILHAADAAMYAVKTRAAESYTAFPSSA